MIPTGTKLLVRLAKDGEEAKATVLSCSKQGVRCKLDVENKGIVTLNIGKLEYKIIGNSGLDNTEARDNPNGFDADMAQTEMLDAFMDSDVQNSSIDQLNREIDENLLTQPSERIAKIARSAIAELYLYFHNTHNNVSKSVPMHDQSQKIYVEGFDVEQIWLQQDMLVSPSIGRLRKQLRKFKGMEKVVPSDVEDAIDDLLASGNEEAESEQACFVSQGNIAGNVAYSSDDQSEEEELGEVPKLTEDDYDFLLQNKSGSSPFDEDDTAPKPDEKTNSYRANARAALEDDYFKIDELERFLKSAEDEYSDGENESDVGEESDEFDGDGLEDALLTVSKLAGKANIEGDQKKKIKLQEILLDSDNEDESMDLTSDPLANARYEDFFGPSPKNMEFGHANKLLGSSDDEEYSGEEDYQNLTEDSEIESEHETGYGIEEEESENEHLGLSSNVVPSAHEKLLHATAKKVAALESDAMAEKDWYLRGEISASSRPKNSALEVDLDFETTVKPPPPPSEEATQDLEEMIKKRIYEATFDDVIKISPTEKTPKKKLIELDDKKSSVGLGEIYEKDYLTAISGTVEDKDEPIRELLRAQFESLCSDLDALSHGSFRPAPSIEDVTVKTDVPAILMEEAAPAFVSSAAMRAPEEVFVPGRKQLGTLKSTGIDGNIENDHETQDDKPVSILPIKDGVFKSEAELTSEDRKRRRAAMKRASKKRKALKEEEKSRKLISKGETYIPGRKSAADIGVLQKMAKAAKSSGNNAINYSKSASVFAKIQAASNGAKENDRKASGTLGKTSASSLML